MADVLERVFEKGDCAYVVDYWGTNDGTQAFEAQAIILNVNLENKTFSAVLYGDTYQKYSFKDFGRIIFDTYEEACEAANKLPVPKSTVFQVIGNRVYKKTVKGIDGCYTDGVFDLVVCFNKGKDVSTREIGISLFMNESDARRK